MQSFIKYTFIVIMVWVACVALYMFFNGGFSE